MSKISAMFVIFMFAILDFASEIQCGSSNITWNDDVLGLLVFKAGMRDPAGALISWNEEDPTPCNWTGIQCGRSNGRVESLSLENSSLSGQIGRGLLKLDQLKVLALSRNNLSGTIEAELFSILESIDLSSNKFSGSIPGTKIGPSMKYLDLSGNQLTGQLPANFFDQCQSLEHFAIARNGIQGNIPGNIRSCRNLKLLDVSENQLGGEIPFGITGLNHLQVLDISRNRMVGGIHPDLPVQLSSLVTIKLNDNQFSGNIPETLGTCTTLKSIDFSNNLLDGVVPQQMQNLSNLVTLKLGGNEFKGVLPEWFGTHFLNLQELGLSKNAFNGWIPKTFANLSSLLLLEIAENNLAGGIPQEIFKLQDLAIFDASKNSLSGEVPPEIFSMKNLQYMNLSTNKFGGKIVVPTSCSSSLQVVDLSHNGLSVSIPDQLFQCPALQHLNLGSNLLYHGIPWSINQVKLLEFLDLSDNHLGGVIPKSIANLSLLAQVNLKNNWLAGPIPNEISKCEKLKTLDLSGNRLNGSIPGELSKLKELQFLDVSWNNFSGAVPKGGVFELLNKTSFQGNAELCGTTLNVVCPMVPKPIVLNPNASNNGETDGILGPRVQRRGQLISISAIIAISALGLIGFGVLVVAICNYAQARRASSKPEFEAVTGSSSSPCSSQSEDLAIGKLVMFTDDESVSKSEELLPSAHALLNKDREIGRGSFGVVYKATVKSGQTFAVKRLLVPGLGRSQVAFEKEVQQLGKIQHPNLVSLQGYYWTSKMQLLINDYMPNGSLYSRLHERPHGQRPLSWNDRFQIARGIAKGLAHLHHAQIIHYDLKSNNVLLTAENRAQISDYGLGNLVPVTDRFSMNSKFQGALGYMAPELASESLKVTNKCDVYGFGVILLELVTGRRPVEYMEDDVVILCDFVRSRLEDGRVMSCIDPSVERLFPEEEVLQVIKLGLFSTSQTAFNRPSMAEAVQILELVKPSTTTH